MEKWFIKNKGADYSLISKQFGISEVLARLIVNRNIKSNKGLLDYINPSIEHLHEPSKMKDISKACDIIIDKISLSKKIRIIGDYDVDGVISTYILYTALKRCNADVDYDIPDRIKDGYGINKDIIDRAYEDGIDTIITCDNGIAAIDQVLHAKNIGMTIIITDHHDIPYSDENKERLYLFPKADAVVNPKQEDCEYPFKSLCGAAVAYKVIEELYNRFNFNKNEVLEFIEYVSIATVCDVMDLVEENRVFVKYGLEMINKTSNIGLRALISETGMLDKEIGVYHLGFIIGPCINASGRLESAKIGLRLLLAKNEKEAREIALSLKLLNDERKELTNKGLTKALELIEETNLDEDRVLVVYLEDCHESLAGIIAGRIKEKYNKPTILLTNSENGAKGSARSIEEYNMFEELNKCKDLLIRFGGHKLAAGLSLEKDNIKALRKRLNEITTLTSDDLMRKVSFDMVLPLNHISMDLIEEISKLEPYGKGNSKPSFVIKQIVINKMVVLGINRNVLKFTVAQKELSNQKDFTAMLFQGAEDFETYIISKYSQQEYHNMSSGIKHNVLLDIVFTLDINEYKGYKNIQLIIQNYRVSNQ